SFPCYNPINSSTSQSSTTNKSTDSLSSSRAQTDSINTLRTHNYPSFFNVIPPINVPEPTTQSSIISSSSVFHSKHSNSLIKKQRPRLTAQLRNEILKIKANQPTAFVWEIQQILLQNGICTSQTLPS
ncbi:unnamed protein product, partial [Rotaria magnacalcarata]